MEIFMMQFEEKMISVYFGAWGSSDGKESSSDGKECNFDNPRPHIANLVDQSEEFIF
jgi:hypothetical protein